MSDVYFAMLKFLYIGIEIHFCTFCLPYMKVLNNGLENN